MPKYLGSGSTVDVSVSGSSLLKTFPLNDLRHAFVDMLSANVLKCLKLIK